jgi:hypothetical protein
MWVTACASAPAPKEFLRAHPNIPDVQYCSLFKDPSRFDGLVVRTTATYYVGFEASALRSSSCSEHWVWVELSPDLAKSTNSRVLHRFNALLESDPGDFSGRSARITAIGIFHGPRKRVILGHTVREGYGHLSGSDYQLDILSIESAGPPWSFLKG